MEDPNKHTYSCFLQPYTLSFRKTRLPAFDGAFDRTTVDEEFWTGLFIIQDLSFDVDFYGNPSPNLAAVRYIETVTTFDGSDGTTPPITDYPFSQTFMQHEFALIDVDDDCKLLKWDQYGDNKERTDVIEATAAILSILLT